MLHVQLKARTCKAQCEGWQNHEPSVPAALVQLLSELMQFRSCHPPRGRPVGQTAAWVAEQRATPATRRTRRHTAGCRRSLAEGPPATGLGDLAQRWALLMGLLEKGCAMPVTPVAGSKSAAEYLRRNPSAIEAWAAQVREELTLHAWCS